MVQSWSISTILWNSSFGHWWLSIDGLCLYNLLLCVCVWDRVQMFPTLDTHTHTHNHLMCLCLCVCDINEGRCELIWSNLIFQFGILLIRNGEFWIWPNVGNIEHLNGMNIHSQVMIINGSSFVLCRVCVCVCVSILSFSLHLLIRTLT